MFCPHKNQYLQLVCAMDPRIINKAVDAALQKKIFDPHVGKSKIKRDGWAFQTPFPRSVGYCRLDILMEDPAAQRLESMQPSLYAPHVDITRAKLGFGRVGLRLINRDLHSDDHLKQLQALHSILDQVQISENAMFLINLQVVYRLMDLMMNKDPVTREKVCMILTHLATYHQGRKRIMSRLKIVENLMWLIMRDRKEIRFAAAYTMRTLARDRCACEFIMKNETVIENLLKMIKHDHTGIVLLHLSTFENLAEWDPIRPLKANAFQVMLTLFKDPDPRIAARALNCMTQLCKHEVGMTLADEYDLNFVLRKYIVHSDIEVIISAAGLMCYTTITTRSKWRAKEIVVDLSKILVLMCHTHNKPQLQLRCLQILMNMCDHPDVRNYVLKHWERQIEGIPIRTHEEWDGTSETSSFGLETGHNYRTMCIEGVETVKNDYGDNPKVVNVHSYLRRVNEKKQQLIAFIRSKPYK